MINVKFGNRTTIGYFSIMPSLKILVLRGETSRFHSVRFSGACPYLPNVIELCLAHICIDRFQGWINSPTLTRLKLDNVNKQMITAIAASCIQLDSLCLSNMSLTTDILLPLFQSCKVISLTFEAIHVRWKELIKCMQGTLVAETVENLEFTGCAVIQKDIPPILLDVGFSKLMNASVNGQKLEMT